MISANTITGPQQNERRRAELYMRIYKFAAEDFVANSDMQTYSTGLTTWMNSVEAKLSSLFKILSTHTHKVQPHTHPTDPHIHISGSPGSPTSPTVVITLPNNPVEGIVPTQKAAIKWTKGTVPIIKNTTGTAPNIIGNMVTMGAVFGQAEDITPHLRRTLVLPILATPSIPPALTGLTVS